MRAVLDPNVLISALLSPKGSPAQLLRAWQHGAFELIVSRGLLAELERALAYPKLRKRITEAEAQRVIRWLAGTASIVEDPGRTPAVSSPDPGDDYLVALAEDLGAVLVSGDEHLLSLAGSIPVFSPAQFLDLLEE